MGVLRLGYVQSDILHAGQIFSMDDVPVDIGPTQHGITRGETIGKGIFYIDRELNERFTTVLT